MSSQENSPVLQYDYFTPKYYERYKDDPDMLQFAEHTNGVIRPYLESKNVSDISQLLPDDLAELREILLSTKWNAGGENV
jgi:hypothetical protein